MVWFRNSTADSCSNLKRSRTELLASISSPTSRGKLVSARKLRICSTGRLSSRTWKSVCFNSVICLPCLSVTLNTTFTSLEPILNLVISSSMDVSEIDELAFAGSVCGESVFGGSDVEGSDLGGSVLAGSDVCVLGG